MPDLGVGLELIRQVDERSGLRATGPASRLYAGSAALKLAGIEADLLSRGLHVLVPRPTLTSLSLRDGWQHAGGRSFVYKGQGNRLPNLIASDRFNFGGAEIAWHSVVDVVETEDLPHIGLRSLIDIRKRQLTQKAVMLQYELDRLNAIQVYGEDEELKKKNKITGLRAKINEPDALLGMLVRKFLDLHDD
jgi:hypothetical protein